MNNFLFATGISLWTLIMNSITTPQSYPQLNDNPASHASKDTFVINFLKRNIRYPQAAVKNNQEKTIYLVLKFNANGTIDKYKISDSLIEEPSLKELVIVGAYNTEKPIKFTDSANLNTELFTNALRTAINKIKIPQKDLTSTKGYHFKVSFRIEKVFDQLSEPY